LLPPLDMITSFGDNTSLPTSSAYDE